MTLFEELKWRGLVKDTTSPEIEQKINDGNVTFYWGTDPSADSLHVGHLSSLLVAKRLQMHGNHPILLIGGATGLIGDPRPTTERAMISKDAVEHNIEGLKKQISNLFDGKVDFVNNYDWSKSINFIDFLRDYGKYFNVNYMLDKDIIRRRLDSGITYTEFSYMIMQALDFLWLYENKNCIMQAAGSDQWGNITAGVDLIKRKLNKTAYAFTMPLVTDSAGKKFGKSEGNAVWLDKEKTSPYTLYQFFINAEDSKVIDYLKIYTFLTKEEIEKLESSNNKHPELREAHKALAYEVTKFVHGEEEADKAKQMSEEIFSGKSSENMPTIESNLTINSNILDILVDTHLAPSKSEARRLVEQGGISVDDEKITDPKYTVSKKEIVLQKGKKSFNKIILK